MKILNILTYYYPHNTGLTRYVQKLSESFFQRGHEITVLTSQHKKELSRETNLNGVKVVRMPYWLNISRGVVMPQFPIFAYREIKKADVVILNTPILESALISIIAGLLKKPYIIVHHGDLILPRFGMNRWIQKIVYEFYKYAARRAFQITAYSRDYAESSYYLLPFIKKVTCIYPPAEIVKPSEKGVEEMRMKFSLEGKKIIGYAGRFVEEKRPDRLLLALSELLKVERNIKIIFAGDYQLKYEKFYERCKPLIDAYKEHLIFLGLVNNRQELANFYSLCDVLVLPSETECLGLVQVESMYCGTPVIVNNIPGAREAVKVTGMGEIVDCKDSNLLAQAILRVTNNSIKYKTLNEKASQYYNLENTVNQYENLLKRAIT